LHRGRHDDRVRERSSSSNGRAGLRGGTAPAHPSVGNTFVVDVFFIHLLVVEHNRRELHVHLVELAAELDRQLTKAIFPR
jgi:hypothetical protein